MQTFCNGAACFLAQKGGLVSFPLVTVAGLVDGINPCAIGMILLLLGYIIIFARQPEKILRLGGAYILTVYLTYLFIGLLFYRSVQTLNFTPYRILFDRILGSVLFLAGVINVKDFFLPGIGISLEIPQSSRPGLLKLVEKVSLPATIILAVLVTLLETPCSLPIYVGTASILNYSGLGLPKVLAYFLYYNFLFILPLLVILFLVWRGREVISLKDWEHKAKRWMKLSIGVLLVLMSLWLLI
ncbi:MAG: cytochrome c biogenesis CcdA family protein [Patescibacteria group bacterium]